MKTILLAAGRSTRLNPLSDKNFFKFNGKFLIEHQIQKLLDLNISDIIVVGGKHNLEKLKDLKEKLDFTLVEQKNLEDGMKGAITSCKDLIQDQEILIVSGNDIVEKSAYKNVLEKAKTSDGVLLAKKVESYFPGGYIELENDKIVSIIEKPGEGNEPSDYVNLVVHYHKHADKLLEYLENAESDSDDLYEVALDTLFKNFEYKAAIYDESWLAIKYPWHVLDVMNMFLENITESQIHESVQISETAVIKGNVIIEEGVKIFDHATIQGPAYIGKKCIIANNALVRGSIMGDRSVAGYSTEIARSFLGDDVWTHSNYIGDSIIDSNVSFGAGTVTGNLRLDEKNILVKIKDEKVSSKRNKLGAIIGSGVRVGINSSIMPGIKVGKSCFVGANIAIDKNIPNNSFVRGNTELIITENKTTEVKMGREEFLKKLK